jgi:NADH:ubiquinone oxidoreductase subunit 6 (subunit J)
VAKLFEFLQASSASVAVVIVFCIYRLLRFSLEASIRQHASARTRWNNFGLACAYVVVVLLATLCVVLLIKPLLSAQHANADHNTAEQPDRAATRDRTLKL